VTEGEAEMMQFPGLSPYPGVAYPGSQTPSYTPGAYASAAGGYGLQQPSAYGLQQPAGLPQPTWSTHYGTTPAGAAVAQAAVAAPTLAAPMPFGVTPRDPYGLAQKEYAAAAAAAVPVDAMAVWPSSYIATFKFGDRAWQEDDAAAITSSVQTNPSALESIGPGGQTPLIHAVLTGKATAVKTLLELGADALATEKDGYNVLHAAGFQGRAQILQTLLDHFRQADADKTLDPKTDVHKDGYFPLHVSSAEKRFEESLYTVFVSPISVTVLAVFVFVFGGKKCCCCLTREFWFRCETVLMGAAGVLGS